MRARMTVTAVILCGCLMGGAVLPQAPEQKDIDNAITKGAIYLQKTFDMGVTPDRWECELIVYTLIHADVSPKKSALLRQGIETLVGNDYPIQESGSGTSQRMVYRMAVRALALHSLMIKVKRNKEFSNYKSALKKFQETIAVSGQYLVDSQLSNGQWIYGGALRHKPEITKDIIKTGKGPDEGENKISSKDAWQNAADLTGTLYKLRDRDGSAGLGTGVPDAPTGAGGDNSNTQYAILGLIAAQKSGCEIPLNTWKRSMEWFEKNQWSNGGFGYNAGDGGDPQTNQSGPQMGGGSNGTMTTAGAVALAACYHYLGRDIKKEPKLQSALSWLGNNFSVTETPGGAGTNGVGHQFVYYYLYGLERVGAFADVKKVGSHDWYAEGAAELLRAQKADGSWMKEPTNGDTAAATTRDTCFAILFLKRATAEIVIETSQPAIIDQK